jgi:hypothetical protein
MGARASSLDSEDRPALSVAPAEPPAAVPAAPCATHTVSATEPPALAPALAGKLSVELDHPRPEEPEDTVSYSSGPAHGGMSTTSMSEDEDVSGHALSVCSSSCLFISFLAACEFASRGGLCQRHECRPSMSLSPAACRPSQECLPCRTPLNGCLVMRVCA